MAFGIYKPGQGYWVRVMTATLAGVMVLAIAAYSWSQLSAVAIPRHDWSITLQPAAGRPIPGQQVRLLGRDARTEELVPIGTAVVKQDLGSVQNGVRVEISQINLEGAARSPLEIRRIEAAQPGVESIAGDVAGTPVGRPIFDPILLQAGVVAVELLIGAALVYWLVGAKPETAEFLIATDGEMKKVNWSTRKEILGSTQVVIIWTFLIAGSLYLVDSVFAQFFQLIGVLQ